MVCSLAQCGFFVFYKRGPHFGVELIGNLLVSLQTKRCNTLQDERENIEYNIHTLLCVSMCVRVCDRGWVECFWFYLQNNCVCVCVCTHCLSYIFQVSRAVCDFL